MQTQLTQLVPISLIEDLIAIGMERGADFAEVYVERGVGSSVGLEEKTIRTAAHVGCHSQVG